MEKGKGGRASVETDKEKENREKEERMENSI